MNSTIEGCDSKKYIGCIQKCIKTHNVPTNLQTNNGA